MVLGLIDIEANYLVIKAYQYTTLTSVQVSHAYPHPPMDHTMSMMYTTHKIKDILVAVSRYLRTKDQICK